MFGSEDDIIDVDTSGGVTNIYLPNIAQNGLLLTRKRIYINDVTGQANINAIIINTIGGNQINGAALLSLTDSGISAEIVITNKTEYIANLSTDNASGGGGTAFAHVDTFIPTLAQTVFTLLAPYSAGTVSILFLNGVSQLLGVDYTISGTTLTYLHLTLDNLDTLQIFYN